MNSDSYSTGIGIARWGTIILVFLLAVFCGLGWLTFNALSDDGDSPAAVSARLTQQEADLKERWQKIEGRSAEAGQRKEDRVLLGQLLAEQTAATAEIYRLQSELARTLGEVDGIEEDLSAYQGRYKEKLREEAVGEIVDLSDTLGKGYEKAKILSVTPASVRVLLPGGPKGIPFEKVGQALQDRFQFSTDEAAVVRQKIQDAARISSHQDGEAREKMAVAQAAENQQRQAEQKEGDRADGRRLLVEAASWKQRAAALQLEAVGLRREHASARLRGNISGHLASAQRKEREAEEAENTARQLRARARELGAD